MLGTHLIADRRPHPLLLAAYSGIFVLTPLAGTSMLADKPPCGVNRLPTSAVSPTTYSSYSASSPSVSVPSSSPPFFAAASFPPSSSGDAVVSQEVDGGLRFSSRQVGSGPRRQLNGNQSPGELALGALGEGGGGAKEDLGACKALGPSWFDILLRIDDPCVCTAVTPQGHLQYGGLDLVYHRALAPWDKPAPCRLETGEYIVGSREIPLALRAMFLAAMAVPYGWLVKPATCGASHAVILTVTWLVVGLFFPCKHSLTHRLTDGSQSNTKIQTMNP